MVNIKLVPPPPQDDTVVPEDHVGAAAHAICYPGVSSCITITGVQAGGLVGAHLTFATTSDELDQFLEKLEAVGAGACQTFYVVGAITRFKASTAVKAFNTRKKIRDRITGDFNKTATVWFCDTTPLGDNHIFAVINGMGADFSSYPTAGNLVKWYEYPAYAGAGIAAASFVLR